MRGKKRIYLEENAFKNRIMNPNGEKRKNNDDLRFIYIYNLYIQLKIDYLAY